MIQIYVSHSFLYQKPMVMKGALHELCACITNVISPHMTDGVTVTSLSAGLQRKTSATTFHLCQIALYRRFSHIVFSKLHQTKPYHINLNSGVNFQVALKQNHTKKKSHKKRPACIHLNLPPLRKKTCSIQIMGLRLYT